MERDRCPGCDRAFRRRKALDLHVRACLFPRRAWRGFLRHLVGKPAAFDPFGRAICGFRPQELRRHGERTWSTGWVDAGPTWASTCAGCFAVVRAIAAYPPKV